MQEHIHDAEQHTHDAEEHIHDVSNIIGYISSTNLVYNGKLSICRTTSGLGRSLEPCLFRVRARLRAFLLCFFFFLTHEYFFSYILIFFLNFKRVILPHWDCIYFTKFS